MVNKKAGDSRDFGGDRPLPPKGNDRLGFRVIAERLAKSLAAHSADEGLVVAIEGEWGSGKSSLVNFLCDELPKAAEKGPEVIRFAPWIVGERDSLVAELVKELALAVEKIGDANKTQVSKTKDQAADLAGKLRSYASKVGRTTAPVAALAGLLGVPGAEFLSKLLATASDAADATASKQSLQDLKDELVAGLSKLGRRIVVIIDDLDRLEPKEAAEITRLVRAVAGFPNVVYLLCYDRAILSKGLKRALALRSGRAFLEKIVQVRFEIPRPQAFDLRRWLLAECVALNQATTEEAMDEDEVSLLRQVCDLEGGSLNTPRDIVHVLNAVRLYWPPIASKAFFPDLVWLQIIRIKSPRFYRWIEDYMVEASAVAGGATVPDSEKKASIKTLKRFLTDDVSTARSTFTIRDFLPGIAEGLKKIWISLS